MAMRRANHYNNWRWRDGPVPPGRAVIFDMDGVLSDAASRQHFITGPGGSDWDAFFDSCGEDPLIEEVPSSWTCWTSRSSWSC